MVDIADKDAIDRATLIGALGGAQRIALAGERTVSLAAPVVLDLDGKGVQTIARAPGGIRYDLDGDGLADLTSWIGATEGFLFLDRDGNNTVTNAGEFSFLADVPGATSDLAGLRAFDTSGDGTLSALDARFNDFRVWQDKNSNGIVDGGEVLTLAAAGVRSINLLGTSYTGANAANDTVTVAKGSYTRTNGTTMDLLDAALTYESAARDGLPSLTVRTGTFDRKASKYRIGVEGGRLTVAPTHGGDAVDPRAGGLSGSVLLSFKRATVGMLTAIVLDLDGNGVSLVKSGKSRGWFDMNGDGSPDQQGWAGRRDGFLVIDRDGDGRITNGSELSLLAEDPTAGSSLAALAKLDSNGDKVVDKNDARFAELKVWVDANGNGVTDEGELKTLAALDIQSIALDSRATDTKVKPGENLVMATATFTYADGTKRTLGDAALAFRPSQPAAPRAIAIDRSAPAVVPAQLDTRPAVRLDLPSDGEGLPADAPSGGEELPVDPGIPAATLDDPVAELPPVDRPTFAIRAPLPAIVSFPAADDDQQLTSEGSGSWIVPADRIPASDLPISPLLATSSDHFASAIAAFGLPRGTADFGSDLGSARSTASGVMVFAAAHG